MLKTLFYPTTVAVIGASRTPGKVGHSILANLVGAGFAGRIIPVNPHVDEILGLPCYPDPAAAHATIDLGIVVVPPPAVLNAVQQLVEAGAKALIVITAGFSETGREGGELERQIVEYAKRKRVHVMGPNCLGLINTENNMNASFANAMPSPGGISVVSQSGALCTALLDWAVGRRIGLAKLISIGNKADLSETEFLTELAQDDQTRVIACYLESINDGDEFVRVAESVTAIKPVVVLKAGVSDAGRRAASSHTGSLAGEDIAYGAAFRRAGVIRADTFEALCDIATALSMQPLPRGNRVAIITNAGGPGIMAADAVENAGLQVTQLTKPVARELKKNLPGAASVNNPIDVLGDADPARYALALKAALNDEGVDAALVILTPQSMSQPTETARAIIAGVDGTKPVLAAFMGGRDVLPAREEFVAAGLPDFTAPERAVAVLRAMSEHAEWCRRPPRVVTHFPVNRHRIERVLGRHRRAGKLYVGEVDAKEILRAYDFSVPHGAMAQSVDEAVAVAERIGYPVAMKIVSPDIVHKSDVGGVRLPLSTPDHVCDAYDLMTLRIGRHHPAARIDGVYIEELAKPGREVILGMHRDAQFGPMLMFGLGGIFVEVMKDVTFHLAPITSDEAMQMLMGTKSYALLQGARGETIVDIDALAGGLQRISQLATDFPQIQELDINPLIVGGVGTAPVVADARMTLSEDVHVHG